MLKKIILAVVAVAALAQLYRPDRTNPQSNPAASFEASPMASPAVVSILKRSCYDCHSNQTAWPWYSAISPMSLMIAADVREARARLNFSEWSVYGPEMAMIRMAAVCGMMRGHKMPPDRYLKLHPDAKVTAEDAKTVCAAIR